MTTAAALLFSPYNLDGMQLNNRLLMAPMNRSRASQPRDIPNALMAAYYAQRASAGIIIKEATQISLQGMGYAKSPDIFSQAQIDGWKLTTDAVHKAGGKIFLQLWHVDARLKIPLSLHATTRQKKESNYCNKTWSI
jgi:N-ethylmaleimide reductase